jgi:hypothetical protein
MLATIQFRNFCLPVCYLKCKDSTHRNVILLVLNGDAASCLMLREQHRLGAFENRVLRGIFGPRTEERTGD